ncbi:MAG TPA: hypothetical protein VGL83_15620 [Stellaceae bacterium]|jgi:hypothetical protein
MVAVKSGHSRVGFPTDSIFPVYRYILALGERGNNMPERVDIAIRLRRQAERLRQMTRETRLSAQLIRMAGELDEEARMLEAAAIRDLGKSA